MTSNFNKVLVMLKFIDFRTCSKTFAQSVTNQKHAKMVIWEY